MADWETELSEEELEEIIHLFLTTKLLVEKIAKRIGHTVAVIASIKRRFVDNPKNRRP